MRTGPPSAEVSVIGDQVPPGLPLCGSAGLLSGLTGGDQPAGRTWGSCTWPAGLAAAHSGRRRVHHRPRGSRGARPDRGRRAASRLRSGFFYYQGIPTGVDNVIASAGVAKMSLYRHFGSKEQLIVECLERLDVRHHDWFVAQVEDRDGDPVSKLLSVFDVLDEWFASDHFRGCAFINATVELCESRASRACPRDAAQGTQPGVFRAVGSWGRHRRLPGAVPSSSCSSWRVPS